MTWHCANCGNPVNPTALTTWHRVVGWERRGIGTSRKGGSDIALRESRNEFSCEGCIRKLQSGISPAQEQLA